MREYLKMRVLEFLSNYGDKGYIVLRTALDIALDPNIDHRLGDFSFKYLAFRLRKQGISYNPSNLLRILEREYGIIEKTYSSSGQKWWSFIDIEAARMALLEYSGVTSIEEPHLRLLLIKYKSLEPKRMLATLKRLSMKPILNAIDKKLFRELVFGDLDLVAEILEEMMKYEDVFTEEITSLQEILSLAERVAEKIDEGVKKGVITMREKEINAESISRGEEEF